jgi:NAD+ kinase
MFKRIGLVGKPGDSKVRDTLRALLPHLQRRRLDIVIDQQCAELLGKTHFEVAPGPIGDGRDLVIVIGGDGTLLRAAHMISSYDTRLLGINVGRLGFLTDIPPEEIGERINEVLDGDYEEEERPILRSYVSREGQDLEPHDAINDVVITKWNIARLITLETYVNGRFVNSQRSDGLIVATPTGSTAYALSGGGPILHPALDALALVPICPHTLSNRPIVVSGQSRIEIVVGTPEFDQARLTCDGEIYCELAPGDRVLIEKADRCVRLIHPPGHDHFATLRAKLQWG